MYENGVNLIRSAEAAERRESTKWKGNCISAFVIRDMYLEIGDPFGKEMIIVELQGTEKIWSGEIKGFPFWSSLR